MRVAIHADAVSHEIPGGIGAYVRRLVDELLILDDGNRYLPIVSRTVEPPTSWLKAQLIRPSLPAAQLNALWNFTRRPKLKEDIDVVHATNLVIPPLAADLVATIHDLAVVRMPEVVPAPWRTVYRKGLKLALEESKILCAVSEATKTGLVEDHRIDPDRIVVTPLAPNVTPDSPSSGAVFERLAISEPYVLCVGTVEPRKNQKRLVAALAETGDALKGWSLVIAGAPGWGQEEVQSQIESRRAGHRVILTGQLNSLELVDLYKRAGVFAFPSLYEGFGLPLIEALGFGIPSLSSTDPALVELAGSAALAVDPLDTAAIAAALARLCGDEDLRERLAREGRERATQFSWHATAAATRQAYARAVSG
ncbi:MAG: glycosyltransferase family 4 protein [Actinomycetota bacterium]